MRCRVSLWIMIVVAFLSFGFVYGQEIRTVMEEVEPSTPPLTLQPGAAIEFSAETSAGDLSTTKLLRIVGRTIIPEPHRQRSEGNFRQWEHFIDDSLDSNNSREDQYSLLFRGFDDNFPREAFYRIMGSGLPSGPVQISFQVKRSGFEVTDNGKFGVEFQLYHESPEKDPRDIYDEPDESHFLPIHAANDDEYSEISITIDLPEDLANLTMIVGGEHFSGNCWIEGPRLRSRGEEIMRIPFVPYGDRESDEVAWVGRNLTTRNWPIWQLSVDGEVVYEEKIFDRASPLADFYIPLSDDIAGGENMRLELVEREHQANHPYWIRSAEIIEYPALNPTIVSRPKYLPVGQRFGILVETQEPNVRLTISSDPAIRPVKTEPMLEDAGLHVLEFVALQTGVDKKITIDNAGFSQDLIIDNIIFRQPDNVYLSTGDEIYIDMNDEAVYDHYVKWFVGERMGNFYHFRPSYQWSGFRKPQEPVLSRYLDLLQGLQMPYAWQVEARTLAGDKLNPTLEQLDSHLFHGKQAHEDDGSFYYWGHFRHRGLYTDIAARLFPYGGIFAKFRPIYTDHGSFVHYDRRGADNMQEGAEQFIRSLEYTKGDSTRHTGPSTLFRYFFKAGYDWVGAEQMYGPEETVISAARGATRAYGRDVFGSLHAMQWGDRPFTNVKKAHRFYLSLATAYMHGSSHINTEEALWLDEHVNDRFSEAGKRHIYGQRKLLDFIETHERRGDLVADIALIQGRNCAWEALRRNNNWAQDGQKWRFGRKKESFDLIQVFYPQSSNRWASPQHMFSETPFGAVDLLPIEASAAAMKRYKALIFLGWNTFDERDFHRIRQYLAEGGEVLLTAAHLNAELQPHLTPRFPEDDKIIRDLLGNNYRDIERPTTISHGAGKIHYIPETVYPADPKMRQNYEALMRRFATRFAEEQRATGWLSIDGKISFTAWDNGQRRTIYMLNIDWDNPGRDAGGTLYIGEHTFEVVARHYELETIHIKDGLAAMPKGNTTDIVAIERDASGSSILVQTTGPDTVMIFDGISGRSFEHNIESPGLHTIEVEPR